MESGNRMEEARDQEMGGMERARERTADDTTKEPTQKTEQKNTKKQKNMGEIR